MIIPRFARFVAFVPLLLPWGVLGCSPEKSAAATAAQGPVEVGVVTLKEETVTLATELPGRLSAFRVAEIRARVNGIVQKRLFEEGSEVKAGDDLFVIDPAPYKAAHESALAAYAKADANLKNARVQSERVTQLNKEGLASKQEVDNAVAQVRVAEADLAAAAAAVKTAKINLDYTKVEAPVSGRIGRAEVTEGAYVQQSTATLMAVVQQMDSMYVDITWSSADVLRLKRDLESGKLKNGGGQAEVKIILEDGRVYPEAGKLQFADVTVDQSTGSISLRAVVPNPRGELLPGMFVRARLEEGTAPAAILVPQRGVTRDANGRATALVVTAEKKVERRTLTATREVGDAWLVTDGVKAGDQVIVEGVQKVRPGADVSPVPAKENKDAKDAPGDKKQGAP
jgi:membrane fusion protein, multidrug efflux system